MCVCVSVCLCDMSHPHLWQPAHSLRPLIPVLWRVGEARGLCVSVCVSVVVPPSSLALLFSLPTVFQLSISISNCSSSCAPSSMLSFSFSFHISNFSSRGVVVSTYIHMRTPKRIFKLSLTCTDMFANDTFLLARMCCSVFV